MEESFTGDVINSYNDGPTNDGSQLGLFCELEASSPSAFLKPGEDIIHIQRTYHLEGSDFFWMNSLNHYLMFRSEIFKG